LSGQLEVAGPTLTLRYPSPDDAAALFALARDPAVTRFFVWGPYRSAREPLSWIDTRAGARERGEALEFVVARADEGPIGVTGIVELSRRDRRCVIGTWFGRRWWGTGVNLESKGLITRLCFDALALENVGAFASAANEHSQRALERAGFVREGRLRAYHRHGDEVHDVVAFSLLRGEWERSPLAQLGVDVRGEPPAAFAPDG